MKKKLLLCLSMALASLLACFSFAACKNNTDENNNENQNNQQESVGNEEEEDAIVWQEKSWSYTDAEGASATLDYALYFPDSYSATGAALPLVTYIPDASYQRQKIAKVETAACPTQWVTEENMKNNPAVFLILTFTTKAAANGYTALDDEHSEQAQVIKLIDSIVEEYNIDENRLYLTGQSMGGIFDWAVNTKYPDKFAATVYVGCQPGNNNEKDATTGIYKNDEMYEAILQEKAFLNQKFVYIASRKDPKAPYGQDDVEQALIDNDVEYGKNYELSKDDAAANSTALKTLFAKGYSRYLLAFPQVGDGSENQEHMNSFAPSYAIGAIYEWLLDQKLGYSDGDKVEEADLPAVSGEALNINLGELKIASFQNSAKLVWDMSDLADGVTQYMLSLSYESGEDVKDAALADVVYYVGITTASGTEWTYCLSSYKKNNGMGGAGTGLNLTGEVTGVTVILENPGDALNKDIFVTLKTNQR